MKSVKEYVNEWLVFVFLEMECGWMLCCELKFKMIFGNGYFGFCIDEECSEMWYLVWIVEFCELLSFWM